LHVGLHLHKTYVNESSNSNIRMNSERVSRRDFLKLVSVLPLVNIDWLPLSEEESSDSPNRTTKDLPSFLILVFDTLSARHMSLYGYQRYTTPNFFRFAEKATVFHRHYSSGNFTTPGTASILTGVYPWTHKGYHLFGTVEDRFSSNNLFSILGDSHHSITYTHNPLVLILLAQFREHIHQLIPIKDLCLRSLPLSDRFSLDDFDSALWAERSARGWGISPSSSLFLYPLQEIWQRHTIRSINEIRAEEFPRGVPSNGSYFLFFLLEDAILWIKKQLLETSRPYIHYFHLLPPHQPYNAHRNFVDLFNDNWIPEPKPEHFFSEGHSEDYLRDKRRQYDQYIANVDYEFGQLLDFLEQNDVMDNTYIIVTSDHGEMFERGIHGHLTPTLYEPIIRVPLLISRPGQSKREDIFSLTSCVDLMPTIINLCNFSIPPWCEGEILPGFGHQPDPGERIIYAAEAKSSSRDRLDIGTLALVTNRKKLIHYFGYADIDNQFELYELESDPEELSNLRILDQSPPRELENELIEKLVHINQRK
jgi:arylsulfatase A-like enzyme